MAVELNYDLQLNIFPGEEIIDDSVWIYKSHDPIMFPNPIIHKANKIIVCVRNPYDILVSIMNFMPIHCQGGTIEQDFQKDIPEKWDLNIRKNTQVMKLYHQKVLTDMLPKVPVYFIRYEDLIIDPQSNLEKLFCFILNKKSIEGLNIQKRITEVIQKGSQATRTYQQKELKTAGAEGVKIKFNKNIDKFTPEQ